MEKNVESVKTFFIGEHSHNLDSKKRLTIPAKFRPNLGEKFVITCGLENCLVIYPMEEWNRYISELTSLPFTKKDTRMFIRFITSKASELSFDKLGRIQLPQNLINYAKISKEVVVNGVLDKLEIWSKESWNKYSEEANLEFIEKAEMLFE